MPLPISYNIRSVRVRWKVTLLAIFGIALVVTVFVTLMAMARGFQYALRATGLPQNAIVVQKGSRSELTSLIQKDQADYILVDPRVKRLEGTNIPMASPEMVTVANLPLRTGLAPVNVTIRGVTEMAFKVRTGIKIFQGERFQPGLYEMIVGKQIQQRVAGLDVGGSIKIQKKDWKVVGVFSSDGSGFESEIWMDVKVMSQAFNRRELYQSIALRMEDPSKIDELSKDLEVDPKMQAEAKNERKYYEEQAGQTSEMILTLAYFVSTIMAIGAVFGGMNTMYAIVASRTREIGTLRALGFSRPSILLSFLLESVFLALVGAVIGCALAIPTNGMTTATGGPNFSQIAFAFRVTPDSLLAGVIFAAVMGIFGGILPALRASRMPIASALKAA